MTDDREDITIDELISNTQATLDGYITDWKNYCINKQSDVSKSLTSNSTYDKSLEDHIAEINEKRNKQGDLYYSLANKVWDKACALEGEPKRYIDYVGVRNSILNNYLAQKSLSLEFVLAETEKGMKIELGSSPYVYNKEFDDILAKTEKRLKETETGKIVSKKKKKKHKQIIKKTNILGVWPELAEKVGEFGVKGESEKLQEHKKEKSFIESLEIQIVKTKMELDETSGIHFIKRGSLKKQISRTQDEVDSRKEKYKEMLENYNGELSKKELEVKTVIGRIADIDGKLKDLGWCDSKMAGEYTEKITFSCKFTGIDNANYIRSNKAGKISELALDYLGKIFWEYLNINGTMVYEDFVKYVQKEAESKYGDVLSTTKITNIVSALQNKDILYKFEDGKGRFKKPYIKPNWDAYKE